jgi:hypothetical protein
MKAGTPIFGATGSVARGRASRIVRARTLAFTLLIAGVPAVARAGALAECQVPGREFEAVARCLTALDLETLAKLQAAEHRAAAAARELDEKTKRGNAAYAAFAQASRAFALFQGAECEYVFATTPGSNIRSKSAGPTHADLARIACRIELARGRIEMLKP